MHFPKHWAVGESIARGPVGEFRSEVWRSSDESPSHAEAVAREAARQLAERLANRGREAAREYPYADRALREPVLREISRGAGCDAVITRTAYGSEVLNTSGLMVVDIDLTPPAVPNIGLFTGLKRLFGSAREPVQPPDEPTRKSLSLLAEWQQRHRDWSFRIYRTFSGLRYLVTSSPQDPLAATVHSALTALGCDPRYQQLCRAQKSFRARLTPKPWRCGQHAPPFRFPYRTAEQERAVANWNADYNRASQPYAVCHFVAEVGDQPAHSALAPLVEQHDAQTKARSDLPLA